jgi:hypothetical protein
MSQSEIEDKINVTLEKYRKSGATQTQVIIEMYKVYTSMVDGDKKKVYDMIQEKLKVPRPTIRRAVGQYHREWIEIQKGISHRWCTEKFKTSGVYLPSDRI